MVLANPKVTWLVIDFHSLMISEEFLCIMNLIIVFIAEIGLVVDTVAVCFFTTNNTVLDLSHSVLVEWVHHDLSRHFV